MNEIHFQAFPEQLLLNTSENIIHLAWNLFHRVLFLVRILQQEAQECKRRLNLIMHAGEEGEGTAMFSQVTHIWEINLTFNGPYIHLKRSYFFCLLS